MPYDDSICYVRTQSRIDLGPRLEAIASRVEAVTTIPSASASHRTLRWNRSGCFGHLDSVVLWASDRVGPKIFETSQDSQD